MNLSGLSDEELMVLYQSGASEAFQVLYRRHSAKIYGFLRRRVWNDERAAELFQEAFLKMHRSKQLYNKALPALPWMFSVTRSVLIDGLRSDQRAKREKEFVSQDSHGEASVASVASVSTDAPEIANFLDRLTPDQRKAIELRYVDEKTFEQVAATLETSAQNARKIISRALAKLKGFASEGKKS
jgi:RNA polymerase sigma-70 factor (ECF subfamily)